MSSERAQARFSEERKHFVLEPSAYKRPPRKKAGKAKKEGSKPHYMFTSKTDYGELKQSADRIFEKAKRDAEIYPDDRVYFKIVFSDEMSWKDIQEAISELQAKIVKVIDAKTAKFAVQKKDYGSFIRALYNRRKVISSVKESTLAEKIDSKLAEVIQSQPEEPIDVTFQVVDMGGIKDSQQLELSLRQYLRERSLGEIEPVYKTNTRIVFDVKTKAKVVSELADALGRVEKVEAMPEVTLESEFGSASEQNLELASIISLSQQTQNAPKSELPIVCAIDSGVNKAHTVIGQYIEDTFDLISQKQGPCTDEYGHGSMVAGIAIFGGNLRNHNKAVARVCMVKGFNGIRPVANAVTLVKRAMDVFDFRTKIFSLSFASDGPNLSLTESLNDLIYSRNNLVVAAAGNIKGDHIKEHLNGNEAYPDYIQKHLIFSPGDSDNSLTVGSYNLKSSNRFKSNFPSAFTKSGNDLMRIKPDVLEDGGNLNTIVSAESKVTGFNCVETGVKSTSFRESEFDEQVGTSFASPAVASLAARVLSRYPHASPYLLKAIVLSSTEQLQNNGHGPFSELLQGYGIPREYEALNSSDWRTCYLLQGEFSGADPNEFHEYSFYVSDNASRMIFFLVVGKPGWSKSYFTFRFFKPGPKRSLVPMPKASERIGDKALRKRITTTYREVHPCEHGGKGEWILRINPHPDREYGADPSLKYGAVVIVESTAVKNVYDQIASWMAKPERLEIRKKEAEVVPVTVESSPSATAD